MNYFLYQIVMILTLISCHLAPIGVSSSDVQIYNRISDCDVCTVGSRGGGGGASGSDIDSDAGTLNYLCPKNANGALWTAYIFNIFVLFFDIFLIALLA